VRGQRKTVDGGDGGDLAVEIRRRKTLVHESCALAGVPLSGTPVVGQDVQCLEKHVLDLVQHGLSLGAWGEAQRSAEDLVDHRRRRRQLAPVPFEAVHHATVGLRAQRLGEHIGIEKEHLLDAEVHFASGTAVAQRLPVLRLDAVAFVVKGSAELLESRPEVAAGPASRRYSASETMTATGRPRRVSVTGSRASAARTASVRWSFAWAMEYSRAMGAFKMAIFMAVLPAGRRGVTDRSRSLPASSCRPTCAQGA
jgi:hypothetical protein